MSTGHFTKIVHEGDYVALVYVELIYTNERWPLYLFLDDAYRLDDIREALKRGYLKAASKLGHIYKLTRAALNARDQELKGGKTCEECVVPVQALADDQCPVA